MAEQSAKQIFCAGTFGDIGVDDFIVAVISAQNVAGRLYPVLVRDP